KISPSWNRSTRSNGSICRRFLAASCRGRILQKCHLDGHVREDARILLSKADPHPYRRLLAISSGNDCDHVGRNGPVRIGIEHGVDGAAGTETADERLVDVDLDLD